MFSKFPCLASSRLPFPFWLIHQSDCIGRCEAMGGAMSVRKRPKRSTGILAALAAGIMLARLRRRLMEHTKDWRALGGSELDEHIEGDDEAMPARLVDARYLIALAAQGGSLPEELPPRAFLSPTILRRLPRGGCYGRRLQQRRRNVRSRWSSLVAPPRLPPPPGQEVAL